MLASTDAAYGNLRVPTSYTLNVTPGTASLTLPLVGARAISLEAGGGAGSGGTGGGSGGSGGSDGAGAAGGAGTADAPVLPATGGGAGSAVAGIAMLAGSAALISRRRVRTARR